MRGFSTELKVGLFAIVVLAVITYMTFKVSDREWFRRDGYNVYVMFSNIAGLDEKTKVKVAGVDAGVIEKITLERGKARVRMRIYPEVVIYKNAVATVKATGLLGDKYLDIKAGSEGPQIGEGGVIESVREPLDVDDMIYRLVSISDNLNRLTANIDDVLGSEESKQALKDTITGLALITENLDSMLESSDRRIKDTLTGIDRLTASINRLVEENTSDISGTVSSLRSVSESLKEDAPRMVEELHHASLELKDLIKESRPRIENLTDKVGETISSVQKIAERIERGEGTLGKLVTDERLYDSLNKAASGVDSAISRIDRFRTFITFQGEYLFKPEDAKGYFNLTLKPREDKYYILGIVGDPLGRVSTRKTITTIDGVTTIETEDEIDKKIEFTAQFARRFTDTALRIGLTESSFGLGADQFFLNDRMKLSADMWDFNNDEEGAKSPHLKLGVDYFIFKNLFLSAGVDNILNSKWRGLYLGSGLTFEDEDFKYLFGTVPSIPAK